MTKEFLFSTMLVNDIQLWLIVLKEEDNYRSWEGLQCELLRI